MTKRNTGKSAKGLKALMDFFASDKSGWIDVYPVRSQDEIEFGVAIILRYPNPYYEKFDFSDQLFITRIGVYAIKGSLERGGPVPLKVEARFLKCQADDPRKGLLTAIHEIKPGPIPLEFADEFLIDVPQGMKYPCAVFQLNKPIDQGDFFRSVLDRHWILRAGLKSIKPRFRLWSLGCRTRAFRAASHVFDKIGYVLFGRRFFHSYGPFDFAIDQFRPSEKEKDKKPKDPDVEVSILGIKAPLHSLVSFCALHLFGFGVAWCFEFKPVVLVEVFKSSLLSIMYLVVALVLYELKVRKYLNLASRYFFRKYESAYLSPVRI